MTKPISATDKGLKPHFKVRVVLPSAILHLASWSAPERSFLVGEGPTVDADWIDDPDYGDTICYIDWSQLVALTWRWSE